MVTTAMVLLPGCVDPGSAGGCLVPHAGGSPEDPDRVFSVAAADGCRWPWCLHTVPIHQLVEPRTGAHVRSAPREEPSRSSGTRSQPTDGLPSQRSRPVRFGRIRSGPATPPGFRAQRAGTRAPSTTTAGAVAHVVPAAHGQDMYFVIPALLTTLSALPITVADGATAGAVTAHPAEPAVAVDPAGRGAWPLSPDPQVVHGFDPPASAYGAGHRGVDLAGSAGQPVLAALAGQVLFAGTVAGKGVVVVGHGDTRTTYEPVTPLVRVGDRVQRGAPIGVLRPGGHCMPGTCLHWGWLRGETYLDPLELVGASGPVRLWPWSGRPAA